MGKRSAGAFSLVAGYSLAVSDNASENIMKILKIYVMKELNV
jgi:hypothetical protein